MGRVRRCVYVCMTEINRHRELQRYRKLQRERDIKLHADIKRERQIEAERGRERQRDYTTLTSGARLSHTQHSTPKHKQNNNRPH